MINFIFDFDSTIVKSETLVDMLKPLLNEEKQKEIESITKMAMEGKISPKESLERRLRLGELNKEIIEKAKIKTKTLITEGFVEFISQLKQLKEINIFIVSGGFKEVIVPTAELLNIPTENIFANEFEFDDTGKVIGVKDSPLIQKLGKVAIINNAKQNNIINGKSIMVGDGYTDLETYLHNAVDDFICFCGVVEREIVKNQSKFVAMNTEQLKEISFELYNKYSKE